MTMSETLFPEPPEDNSKIYAFKYENPGFEGLLKIGYTGRDVRVRCKEQHPTKSPIKYTIVLEESAMRNDGTSFRDSDIHAYLRRKKIKQVEGEWYECTEKDVMSAILAVKHGFHETSRTLSFVMRPEQRDAVERTALYFTTAKQDHSNRTPRFLWNAKMRFGKTFAAYQLARKMKWRKVLVLTFKPAVESAWEEDLKSHIDFDGWQFVSKNMANASKVSKERPIICFGSFQDYLGKNKVGGIKAKNEWVHEMRWDCVILDEYHFGAWRDNAKELFETEKESEEIELIEKEMPIKAGAYLYLTGTPFRALSTGELIEEQIYHWTYTDEQKAKSLWKGANNPYESLPRMVMLTYKMPDTIRAIATKGEYDEFNLNEFFSASGRNGSACFKYESEVQKWLDIIRGSCIYMIEDNLKFGAQKPLMPYSDARLLNLLSHTVWFLPSVSACFAMRNLLKKNRIHFIKIIDWWWLLVIKLGREQRL